MIARLSEITIWSIWVAFALIVNFGCLAFAWLWDASPRPPGPMIQFVDCADPIILARHPSLGTEAVLELMVEPVQAKPTEVTVSYEWADRHGQLVEGPEKVVIESGGTGKLTLSVLPRSATTSYSENTEVRVVLQQGPDYRLGPRSSQTLRITDQPRMIHLDLIGVPDDGFVERGHRGTIKVKGTLDLPPVEPLVVGFRVGGTAAPFGEDPQRFDHYLRRQGRFEFPPGQRHAEVEIRLRDDPGPGVEEVKSVVITLDEHPGFSVAFNIREMRLPVSAPILVVAEGREVRVKEGHSATITVRFKDDGMQAPEAFSIPVDFRFTAGPGQADSADFSAPLPGSVEFGKGASSATLEFAVAQDGIFEGLEQCQLVFRPPHPYEFAQGNTVTLSLEDADPPPSVGFSRERMPFSSHKQSDRIAPLPVELEGPPAQMPVVVKYAVTEQLPREAASGDQPAIEGQDFRLTSQEVRIPAAASTARIDLEIVPDTTIRGTKWLIFEIVSVTPSDIGIDESRRRLAVRIEDDRRDPGGTIILVVATDELQRDSERIRPALERLLNRHADKLYRGAVFLVDREGAPVPWETTVGDSGGQVLSIEALQSADAFRINQDPPEVNMSLVHALEAAESLRASSGDPRCLAVTLFTSRSGIRRRYASQRQLPAKRYPNDALVCFGFGQTDMPGEMSRSVRSIYGQGFGTILDDATAAEELYQNLDTRLRAFDIHSKSTDSSP